MTAKELEAMPAEAYLTPELFTTWWPAEPHEAQYEKGLSIGKGAKYVHINERSVWGAVMADNSIIQSYEMIGYHAGTAALLRGFLDSGCKIRVRRGDTAVFIK